MMTKTGAKKATTTTTTMMTTGGAESNFEGYCNKNGYRDDNNGTEMVYNGVFKEIYNPNKYEGLGKEEEACIARMNHEKRKVAKMRRKKRKLPFCRF